MNLKEHIENLTKITGVPPEDIYKCGFNNHMEYDESGLLIYNTKNEINGKYLNLMFVSGMGEELWARILDLKDLLHCDGIYCVTKRPKGIERKYGFKPMGTLMKWEG